MKKICNWHKKIEPPALLPAVLTRKHEHKNSSNINESAEQLLCANRFLTEK